MSVYLGNEKVGVTIPVEKTIKLGHKFSMDDIGISRLAKIFRISETQFLFTGDAGIRTGAAGKGVSYCNTNTDKIVTIDSSGSYGYFKMISENELLILPGCGDESPSYGGYGKAIIFNTASETFSEIPFKNGYTGDTIPSENIYFMYSEPTEYDLINGDILIIAEGTQYGSNIPIFVFVKNEQTIYKFIISSVSRNMSFIPYVLKSGNVLIVSKISSYTERCIKPLYYNITNKTMQTLEYIDGKKISGSTDFCNVDSGNSIIFSAINSDGNYTIVKFDESSSSFSQLLELSEMYDIILDTNTDNKILIPKSTSSNLKLFNVQNNELSDFTSIQKIGRTPNDGEVPHFICNNYIYIMDYSARKSYLINKSSLSVTTQNYYYNVFRKIKDSVYLLSGEDPNFSSSFATLVDEVVDGALKKNTVFTTNCYNFNSINIDENSVLVSSNYSTGGISYGVLDLTTLELLTNNHLEVSNSRAIGINKLSNNNYSIMFSFDIVSEYNSETNQSESYYIML